MVAVPSKGRADAGFHRIAPEAAATRELYERYAAKIFAFCLSRLRDREEAEDATQSTFLNAFRGLQRGIAPEHEQAWLYKIAENVCLTRQRSRVRRRRVEAPGDLDALQDTLPSPVTEADELLQLPEALQTLPEQQRRALLLREWQGLSYREIAEELDLSQAAVETLLFRARRSLAEGLEEPKKRRLVARIGDTGSLAALLKTLFFSGGAKVVVAGMVAAGTVVAGSSTVRHSLEHAVLPQHHKSAPAPAPHAAAVSRPAPVAVLPAPVHHPVATVPAKRALVRHRVGHVQPVAPVQHHVHFVPTPAASAPGHSEHAARNVSAVQHGRAAQHQAAPSTDARTSHNQAASPPAQAQHGNGRGHQPQSQDQPQSQAQLQSQSQGNPHQQAPTQPTPADQATGAVDDAEQQATSTAQGVVNGLGHAKK